MASTEINLEKYTNTPVSEIPLDPRPRITNVVRELEEEHGWTWPPQPHKDFEKSRAMKRRKWSCLYSKECLDISSILALIIGPWELLVALGFVILPKTFVPALRESSEFCIIFVTLFLFQGFKHTFVALLGLGLRSMHPYLIGFVHVSWPYETAWPLFGIFISAVGFYTTQGWRVKGEMTLHLKGYTSHWFSRAGWDRYQSFMRCCGITDYEDWKKFGPSFALQGKGAIVPKSCCVGSANCVANKDGVDIHTWGCLEMTSITLDIIFISGTICMVIGVILGILGNKSLREAEDCVGDPIHTLLFQPSSGSSKGQEEVGGETGIESKSLRRAELLSLLDHYCLLVGQEMGLKDEVSKARQQLGLDPEGPKAPGKIAGGRKSKAADVGGKNDAGAVSPKDGGEEIQGDDDEDSAANADPKPPRLSRTPRIHPIPPQPLRLAPKLIISTAGDAGKDAPPPPDELPAPIVFDKVARLSLENVSVPLIEEEIPGPSSQMNNELVTESRAPAEVNLEMESDQAKTDADDNKDTNNETEKTEAKKKPKSETTDNENVDPDDSILNLINF